MSQNNAEDVKKAPRDISCVDPNFKAAEVGGEPVEYVNAMAGGPFRMTGFPWQDAEGLPRRLPADMTVKDVNEGAIFLSQHTSGGQIAFRTDSRYIAIRADINVAPHDMGHMPRTGSSGFDFYEHTADGYAFRKVIAPTPEHLKGEILEMGTPEELMELKGKYYKLIQIQTMSDQIRKTKEEERFD